MQGQPPSVETRGRDLLALEEKLEYSISVCLLLDKTCDTQSSLSLIQLAVCSCMPRPYRPCKARHTCSDQCRSEGRSSSVCDPAQAGGRSPAAGLPVIRVRQWILKKYLRPVRASFADSEQQWHTYRRTRLKNKMGAVPEQSAP